MENNAFIIREDVLEKYVGAGGDVVVPEGIRVIARRAFMHSAVRSVILPATVREIDTEAFSMCASLTSVTCPEGLEKIGGYAFRLSALTTLILPSTLSEIGAYAFASCKALGSVTIKSASWRVGSLAFKNCLSLHRFVGAAPDHTESMDKHLFDGCPYLPAWFLSFTNDQGLKRKTAIYWLQNPEREENEEMLAYLKSDKGKLVSNLIRQEQAAALGVLLRPETGITFSLDESDEWLAAADGKPLVTALLLDLRNRAFTPEEIERHTLEKDEIALGIKEPPLAEWEKRFVLDRTPEGYVICGYRGKEDEVAIPEKIDGLPVIAVGEDAFHYQPITKVSLPASLLNIEKSAFEFCSELTDVDMEEGIVEIGEEAFAECSSLVNISLPRSLRRIGDGAFSRCDRLKDVIFSEGLVSIGKEAFCSCSTLTDVTLPASLVEMKGNVFPLCGNIDSISVQNGNPVYYSEGNCVVERKSKRVVVAVGADCSVPQNKGILTIGARAFCGNDKLTSIILPDGITTIEPEAFKSCDNLREIRLPEGVIEIGKSAFSHCKELQNVHLPDSVERLGEMIFFCCKSLTEIVLPERTEKIDANTFSYCDQLTTITFPARMNRFSFSAFNYCKNLSTLIVPEGNKYYRSEGNCVIERASGSVVLGGNKSVIPTDGSIRAIDHEAFYGRRGFSSIYLPDSIEEIGPYAFHGCKELVSVDMPSALKEIGYCAFSDCRHLTDLRYRGSKEQWATVTIGSKFTSCDYVHCADGKVKL